MEKRNQVIDIAKGEILLFIILFHFLNSPADYFGNLFGLAALFIFSGYTTNYDKYSFKEYLILKIKTLFAPAMIINTSLIIFDIFRKYINNFLVYGKLGANQILGSTFTIAKDSFKSLIIHFEPYYLADPTWFLILLFFSCVLGKLVHDIVRKYNKDEKVTSSKVLFIATILLTLFYYLLYCTYSKINFYYLDIVPVAFFFIATGQFVKQNEIKLKEITKIILFILSIAFIYLCFKLEVGVNWYQKTFPNIIIMITAAYAGTFAAVYIDQVRIRLAKKFNHEIKHTKIINKYAISIVLFHMFSLYIMDDVLRFFSVPDSSNLTTTVQKALYAIVYILAGVVIPVGLTKLYNAIKIDKEEIKTKKRKKSTIKVKEDKILLNKKFIQLFDNKKRNYVILIILILLNSIWLFKSYFIFDDWNALALSFVSYKEILLNLGNIITKFIVSLFSMNYVLYAVLITIIHIVNTLLIYNLILKKYKDNKRALSVSLLFSLNPITIQATYYFSAITYLLGTTILLIILNIYNNTKKTFVIVLLYILAILINKTFIFIPILLLINELLNKKIKENKYIFIMLFIMIIGLIINNYSVMPLKTLFNYICLYFNTNSFIFDNNNVYTYSYIIAIITIICISILYAIYKINNKNYIPLLLMISFVLFLIPISNISSIYLYVPSIFISIFIINLVFDLLDKTIKNKSITIMLLLIIIMCIKISEPVSTNIWLIKNTAELSKYSYNYFDNLDKNINKINIINDSNYYLIGVTDENNNLIKKALNNKNIKVTVNAEEKNDYTQIKYNNYTYRMK